MINKLNINKKVEEFFFDFSKSKDEYEQAYRLNHPEKKHVRFSPLYLICRDIDYCFGRNPEIGDRIKTGSEFGPAIFIGTALIYQVVENLSKNIIGEKADSYFSSYLDSNKNEEQVFRELRNAIIHDNYSLHSTERAKKQIRFRLDESLNALIRQLDNAQNGESQYIINPDVFRKRFKNSLSILKDDILHGKSDLGKNFNNHINSDNWLTIFVENRR